jgi:hypothetical protein
VATVIGEEVAVIVQRGGQDEMAVRRGGKKFAEGRNRDRGVGKTDFDGKGEGDQEEQGEEQQRRQDQEPMRLPSGEHAAKFGEQQGSGPGGICMGVQFAPVGSSGQGKFRASGRKTLALMASAVGRALHRRKAGFPEHPG